MSQPFIIKSRLKYYKRRQSHHTMSHPTNRLININKQIWNYVPSHKHDRLSKNSIVYIEPIIGRYSETPMDKAIKCEIIETTDTIHKCRYISTYGFRPTKKRKVKTKTDLPSNETDDHDNKVRNPENYRTKNIESPTPQISRTQKGPTTTRITLAPSITKTSLPTPLTTVGDKQLPTNKECPDEQFKSVLENMIMNFWRDLIGSNNINTTIKELKQFIGDSKPDDYPGQWDRKLHLQKYLLTEKNIQSVLNDHYTQRNGYKFTDKQVDDIRSSLLYSISKR